MQGEDGVAKCGGFGAGRAVADLPVAELASCVCEVRDNDGVVAACSDAFVVKMADALDGPVAGDPDRVEAPPGSRLAVLSPSGAVGDRERA